MVRPLPVPFLVLVQINLRLEESPGRARPKPFVDIHCFQPVHMLERAVHQSRSRVAPLGTIRALSLPQLLFQFVYINCERNFETVLYIVLETFEC